MLKASKGDKTMDKLATQFDLHPNLIKVSTEKLGALSKIGYFSTVQFICFLSCSDTAAELGSDQHKLIREMLPDFF